MVAVRSTNKPELQFRFYIWFFIFLQSMCFPIGMMKELLYSYCLRLSFSILCSITLDTVILRILLFNLHKRIRILFTVFIYFHIFICLKSQEYLKFYLSYVVDLTLKYSDWKINFINVIKQEKQDLPCSDRLKSNVK